MTTRTMVVAEYPAIEMTELVQMEHGETYCLPHQTLTIRVLNGTAWITSQSKDYLLAANEEMAIPRQPHAVLVSAVGHHPLRFEIRKC